MANRKSKAVKKSTDTSNNRYGLFINSTKKSSKKRGKTMRNRKFIIGLVAGVFSSLTLGMTAFAGTWQQSGAGWTYLKDNSQYANNEFVIDENQLYYIGPDYIMKTGFVPLNNAYYYFGPAGNMQTGWVYDNDAWYYMQQDAAHFGQMIVDKIETINDRIYYFGTDGKMAHDTITHQMFFGSDGGAVTYDMLQQMTSEDYAKAKPLTTPDSGATFAAAYDHDAYVEDVFELTNKVRKKKGRSALELDDDLCEYADMRAEQIVDDFSHDYFTEDPEIQEIAGNVAIAENIAKGQKTPDDVVAAWVNSSGHYKSMINKTYHRLGVGVYNSNGYMYWVQIFAE